MGFGSQLISAGHTTFNANGVNGPSR